MSPEVRHCPVPTKEAVFQFVFDSTRKIALKTKEKEKKNKKLSEISDVTLLFEYKLLHFTH